MHITRHTLLDCILLLKKICIHFDEIKLHYGKFSVLVQNNAGIYIIIILLLQFDEYKIK